MPKATLSNPAPPTAWRARLAWAAALAAVIAALLIAADSVHWAFRAYSGLPFWDQWDRLVDIDALRKGQFGFSELVRQHGEHRIVFPRLIFLADALWGGDRDILNLVVIALIQTIHAIILMSLLRPLNTPGRIAAAAGVAALLAFLGQWENFVWGFQVQFVGVYLMATCAFLLVARAARARGAQSAVAFAGACLCLFVAAFSMANGMGAGIVAVALSLALGAPLWMSAALAALTLVCAALYLHGYVPTPDHSSVAYALGHLRDYAAYLLGYVGNIAGLLADRPVTARFYAQLAQAPLALGALGLVLALTALVREVRRRFSEPAQAALLAIMAFVLASAALTALGRLNFGLAQAHAPRYQTPGAIFWAAQLIYWTRAVGVWSAPARRLGAVALIALFALLGWSQVRLGPAVNQHGVAQRAAADALRSRVRDDAAIAAAYPRPGELWAWSEILDRYDLSIYGDREAHWLGRPLAAVARPSGAGACTGAFDALAVPGRNAPADANASGWAWSTADRDAPHRIVLVSAAGAIVGFGDTGVARPDVRAARPEVKSAASGWTAFTHVDGGAVRAFAILRDGSACLLGTRTGTPRG